MGARAVAGGGSDDGQRADDTGNGDDDDGTGDRGVAGAPGGAPRLPKKQKKALRKKEKQWVKQAAHDKEAMARRRQTRNEAAVPEER
jgi:hypothetical protein